MLRLLAILSVLGLSGCGTYTLGQVTEAPGGNTVVRGEAATRYRLDQLECKEKARLAASTSGMQATAFLMGLTVVAAPAAYQLDRDVQRRAWADCMTARGYKVTLGQD